MEARLTLVVACLALVLSGHQVWSYACGRYIRSKIEHSPDVFMDVQCDDKNNVASLVVNCTYTRPQLPNYDMAWSLMLFHGENLDQITNITDVTDTRRIAVKLTYPTIAHLEKLNDLDAVVSTNENEDADTPFIAYKWTTNVPVVDDHPYMCLAVVRNIASLVVRQQRVYAVVDTTMLPKAEVAKPPAGNGAQSNKGDEDDSNKGDDDDSKQKVPGNRGRGRRAAAYKN